MRSEMPELAKSSAGIAWLTTTARLAATLDGFVCGENLAQQQPALLVLRTAQVPQDLLADVVRHDHQQAGRGWRTR